MVLKRRCHPSSILLVLGSSAIVRSNTHAKKKNNKGATFRLKSLIFFRRNVVPDRVFRPIVVLDEVSIRRNGFRRNVVHPKKPTYLKKVTDLDRIFFLPKSVTLFCNDFLTLTQTQNVFVWQERGILLLRCLSICLSVSFRICFLTY